MVDYMFHFNAPKTVVMIDNQCISYHTICVDPRSYEQDKGKKQIRSDQIRTGLQFGH